MESHSRLSCATRAIPKLGAHCASTAELARLEKTARSLSSSDRSCFFSATTPWDLPLNGAVHSHAADLHFQKGGIRILQSAFFYGELQFAHSQFQHYLKCAEILQREAEG